MNVGHKIKQLRQQKDWTLADLSKTSGITLSTLSRIETDKMTGTLESHMAIAKALQIRLSELYDDAEQTAELHRKDKGIKVTQKRGGQIRALVDTPLEKQMFPSEIALSQGETLTYRASKKAHECWYYVLKGSIRMHQGEQSMQLRSGDSVYCWRNQTLKLENTSAQTAQVLQVSTPPQLS